MVTDDIVTRMRALVPLPLEFADESAPAHLISEAADEIERLRAELKRWDVCELVHDQLCGWDSERTFCDKCKAVRGE